MVFGPFETQTNSYLGEEEKMSLLSLKELNNKMALNFFRERIPTRNGYGDALIELGNKNKNVVVLCADLTESTRVQQFKEKFPNRFIEIGVAEQNLVTVGSGLAAVGNIPFVSS